MQTVVIKETLLSRKPRPNSVPVAVLSVMLLLFTSLLHWKGAAKSEAHLAAVSELVFKEGEYWRLLTTIGVHADFGHFAVNALLYLLFSYLLYGYFGFWIYPVLTLLLGSFANYLSLMSYPANVSLIGASGVVYLMAGFWLTTYILIERTRSLDQRLLRATGVGLIVLIPSSLQEHISYRTHAIGCVLGVALAVFYFTARKSEIRSAEVTEAVPLEDL